MAASTRSTGTPCLASACRVNRPAISSDDWPAAAESASRSRKTSRSYRREVLPPPRISPTRPSSSASRVLSGGVFQNRCQRGCATWSYSVSRRLSSRPAIQVPGRESAGPGGMWPKYCSRLRARGGDVDVARQHQHGVGGAIEGAEPFAHVVERGGVEVLHRPDRQRAVRMPWRKAGPEHGLRDLAVGAILALPLLVLHDAALFVEARLRDHPEQVAHAVAFHPQREVERRGRHVLEVIRAVEAGGAVDAGRADQLERLEVLVVVVLGALEHQVFKQVREAGSSRGLVLGADVIPEVDCHDRRLAIGVHDHREAVVEREFLVGDQLCRSHGGCAGRCRPRRRACRPGQAEGCTGCQCRPCQARSLPLAGGRIGADVAKKHH